MARSDLHILMEAGLCSSLALAICLFIALKEPTALPQQDDSCPEGTEPLPLLPFLALSDIFGATTQQDSSTCEASQDFDGDCQIGECVQERGPRLGLNNAATPCGPCDTCDSGPEGTEPLPLLPFLALSDILGDTVGRCVNYWTELTSQGFELAYDGEGNDVDLNDLCEFAENECRDIATSCGSAECDECEVCPRNQFSLDCVKGGNKGDYDLYMYYRNESACQDECVLCEPCVSNATHIIHRDFEKCSEDGVECSGYDQNPTDCSNQVSVCNDPCNCNISMMCVPVFSEDQAEEEKKYCDGAFEQHNRALLGPDDVADDGTKNVQCDECVPCECTDSVCEANHYVDPDNICGTTKDFYSCGVRRPTKGPCNCADDNCERCAGCPKERFDIWLGSDLDGNDIFGSTICYHGKAILPESEWKVASQCVKSDCTNPAKIDEICQCNCVDCVEQDFLRTLCDAEGLILAACLGETEDLTCNAYYQESYRSDLYYSWNSTSCSCEICGETAYFSLTPVVGGAVTACALFVTAATALFFIAVLLGV